MGMDPIVWGVDRYVCVRTSMCGGWINQCVCGPICVGGGPTSM